MASAPGLAKKYPGLAELYPGNPSPGLGWQRGDLGRTLVGLGMERKDI
jgi:hypothetical protein